MGKNTQSKKTGSVDVLKPKILREFSSGGIVFKEVNGEVLWLVTASAPNKLYPKVSWRFPKGWIDDSDTWEVPGPKARGDEKATEDDLQKAALKEVEEEGGVTAKIIKKIGTERFFFNSKTRHALVMKFVTFYLMEWIRDLGKLNFETSEVAWLPFDEAYKKLTQGGEKQMLKKAHEMLALVA